MEMSKASSDRSWAFYQKESSICPYCIIDTVSLTCPYVQGGIHEHANRKIVCLVVGRSFTFMCLRPVVYDHRCVLGKTDVRPAHGELPVGQWTVHDRLYR